MDENRSNWAGNYTYEAARIHYPETVEQVQEIVRGAHKVKALGSRHSFNNIADTREDLISLSRLERSLAVDRDRHTLTVDGGAKYGYICGALHKEGYALHNMASLPHISVAGACATATHGSGVGNGNLATAVSALEFVRGDGEVAVLSREKDPEQFAGAVVSLGGLGVITRITLDVVPAFQMRQTVYENLPFSQVEAHFDEIMSSAYSVSLFTDWQGEDINQVWVKEPLTEGDTPESQPEFYGAKAAPTHRHPIAALSAQPCTLQMGIPGPWYERLPHFRMEFTPSSGEELQTEYILPRSHAVAAMRAVIRLNAQIAPLIQVTEIRTVAADNLWMSPCYGQDCIAIHFTWKKDWQAVRTLLPLIEDALEPFNAMPHWGKLFTMSPEKVKSLYPRLTDFRNLLRSYDPEGKFRNAFLDTYIFGA